MNIKEHNIDKKQGSALIKKEVLGEREILKRESGKPYCRDLFFNISHSGDFVLLAVSDFEIGIDIEKIRDVDLKISDRCFEEKVSTKEEFFSMWTKKESIIKYLGKTIISMKNINVKDYGKLLKTSDFFDGYAFCICSEDKFEIEYIKIPPSL